MKTLKYTTAALALIAAAAFTTSANAQTAAAGDIILGIYDTTSGGAPNSYEVDLGAFNTLKAGETFVLGTSLASTFASDSTPSLVFDIAGAGSTGGGGLASKEVAFTAPAPFTVPANTQTTTPNNNITGETSGFPSTTLVSSSTSSTGTAYQIATIANTNGQSFDSEVNSNGGSYGISGQGGNAILTAYTIGSTTSTDFFTNVTKGQPTADGTFELTGSGAGTELIFSPTAAPEPSTYALMAGGLLALWAFQRSRKNA